MIPGFARPPHSESIVTIRASRRRIPGVDPEIMDTGFDPAFACGHFSVQSRAAGARQHDRKTAYASHQSVDKSGAQQDAPRADHAQMPGMQMERHEPMNMQPENFIQEIMAHATSGTSAQPDSTPAPDAHDHERFAGR